MEMAWQKHKRPDEERAREALQADKKAAEEALQADKEAALQSAEKALQAANESGSTVRNFYITFLLLGVYVGIIIASTTDCQLLLISPVTLPLLNVQLPILGFYIFVPWLFLLAHFNLLLQLFLMSDKLRVFVRASAALPDGEAESLHKQLIDFPAVEKASHPLNFCTPSADPRARDPRRFARHCWLHIPGSYQANRYS